MGTPAGSDPWETLRHLPLGQRVEIVGRDGRRWNGSVIPPNELSGPRVLILKLESGYNVGVRIDPGTQVRLEGGASAPPAHDRAEPPPARAGGPGWTALLTTGGTFASRVDYETGGVRPVEGESELLELYPELARAGGIRVVPVFDRMSEDLRPEDWVTLAQKSVEAFRDGASGVVIAHGTDTLAYTASALSFLVADPPGPIVLVGAQRSPDRPSSDGPSNLLAAVDVARDRRFGEVVAVMHAGFSDGRFAIHRGTWVRKMHSTRRDAFESRNAPPLGYVDAGRVEVTGTPRAPGTGPARFDGPIDPRGTLLWAHPGLTPLQAAALTQGMRGVIVAGTGLGHIGAHLLSWVRGAIQQGQVVAMTTQCLAGEVDPYVYATGRTLHQAGVVYLEDLLPETAYTKLLWALGHETTPDGVRQRLIADRAGEFVGRRQTEGSR